MKSRDVTRVSQVVLNMNKPATEPVLKLVIFTVMFTLSTFPYSAGKSHFGSSCFKQQ